MNRLTSQTAGGALRFAGMVSEPATVTIQGQPATVDASNHFAATASLASGTNTVTIAATGGSGNTQTNQFQIDASGAGATLAYDANGNLTSDGTRSFTWDAANRLLSVTIGTHTSTFTYDGLSRRVAIVEADNGTTASNTKFLWCGLRLCEARDSTGATVTKRYLAQGVQDAGTAYFYTHDHLGSVRELTDSAGVLHAPYDYDPWGQRTKVSGDKDGDVGFTGHFEHGPSGLTLAPFRAYDSNLGRWISEDPAGRGGGPNLYQYSVNGPATFVDPDGKQATVAPGIWLGGLVGGPPGAVVGGVIGAGLGLVIGDALWDYYFNQKPRGLPPDGVYPPGEGPFVDGPASRPSEAPRGGRSLWDPTGGEWRYVPEDTWRNPHWDYNPHDVPNSEWQNRPIGDRPTHKSCAK